MKKINHLFILSFAVLFMAACSSGTDKNNTENKKDTVVKENFTKAEIIDKVEIKSDANQSYALYLPSNYSVDKEFPIIYIFDAHGSGKYPISLYKNLAEKYGYILVGSNNSKNGNTWEETVSIFDKLYTDTKNRLAINSKRIYLMGFSGGARVANALTILSGNIEGVICVGAVYPARNSETPRNNYTLIAIAGKEDMNYTELVKYDMMDLAGHNIKHVLVTYDGKHEWSPESIMEEAFIWLEFNEMRKNLANKNDTLVKKKLNPLAEELKQLMDEKKYLPAFKLCKKTINFFDGLADLSPFYNAYKELQTSKEIDLDLQKEEEALQKEEKLKQEYTQFLQTKDFTWWQKEMINISAKTKSEKNKNEQQLYKRLLSYLSLICYSQTNVMLQQNNIVAAEYFGKLYVLVDPTNSEANYFWAVISAKKNNEKETFNALNKAITNGFDDKARIENDTVFSKFKSKEEFQKMMSLIGGK